MVSSIHPKSQKAWRQWLEKNHSKKEKVDLIMYKKHTGKPTISHKESMFEAICFGWIDTRIKRIDENRYKRGFVRRKKNANWSPNTLSYAKKLIKEGLMTTAGIESYKLGLKKPLQSHKFPKNPKTPLDLIKELKKLNLLEKYNQVAPSYRRFYVYWLNQAVQEETKQRRIKKIINQVKNSQKPNTKIE